MIRSFRGPSAPFAASVEVPGDKSLSHRALIFAAMAKGESLITGLGPGADIGSTANALRLLGVDVESGRVISDGVGAWSAPSRPIDAGNSGTTMRLLAGALAGRPFESVLDGDESLRSRPMERLVRPLGELGASIETTSGCPPIKITGGELDGTDIALPIASAQVRSAVALAAVQANGPTRISSPSGFRDHTERRLEADGLGHWDGETFVVTPGDVQPRDSLVPSDPSSAAFMWVAAALSEGSVVETDGVSLNPGRTGILDALRAFGARVSVRVNRIEHGEPIGSVRVVGPSTMRGIDVSGELTVRCLDEIPLIGLLGSIADGPTTIRDATELRFKESDRIATTVAMLDALGAVAEPTPDGLIIHGGAQLVGGRVDSNGDHRIAMAAAVAASTTQSSVEVVGIESASVSWPQFSDALEAAWSSR